MSNFSFVVLVCALSFAGAVSLAGVRIFLVRKLSAKNLHDELVSDSGFFADFAGVSRFFGKVVGEFGKFFVFLAGISRRFLPRKYYCRFLNFVRGRHAVEKNGCEGYWEKLNGNGSTEPTKDGKEEEK